MKYNEVMEALQNLIGFKPSAKELVNILGLSSPKTIYQRAHRNSDFTELEVKILKDHYCRSVADENVNLNTTCDKAEIKYFEHQNLKTNIKSPAITSIWFDSELVTNIWRKDPKNLRIITMLGDKMDLGEYPLKNGDILIIDTSETDITKAGIYAFTTHNNNYMFINGVNRRYDGMCRFYFTNQMYPEKVLSDEDIKNADIKIIGRVIKNLSLCL